MQFNLLTRQTDDPTAAPGVYVSLDTLLRLQAQASGFSFLPRQPIHSILAGRHASRLRGRGLSFEEIRGYLPGDDTRNMDWKVTARTRKPHVRVFTEERDRYRVDFQQRLDWFRTISRLREMPLLSVSTSEEVGPQIRQQLGQFAQ